MFSFGTATRMDEKLDLNLGFTWAILNELGRGVSRGHEVTRSTPRAEKGRLVTYLILFTTHSSLGHDVTDTDC